MNTVQEKQDLYLKHEGVLTVDAPSIHAVHGAMAKGKKTEAGKSLSALNARKHGLSSKTFVVLPTERMDLFLEHKLQFENTYRPRDAMEFELVGQLAEAVWLIDRSKDMERAAMRMEIQRQRLAFEERGEGYEECMLSWLAMEELQVKNRAFTNLMRYRAQHERTLFRCQRALDTHRKNKSLIPAAGLNENLSDESVHKPEEPVFVPETQEYKTKPPLIAPDPPAHTTSTTGESAKVIPNMPNDLEFLQGRWFISALEIDGSPASFAGAQIVLDGNTFRSLSMGAVYEGVVSLDGKNLTMQFTKGPEQGNTNHGIYEINGDHWRLCLAMTGGPAPKAFATSPGTGHALETFSRQAPATPAIVGDGSSTEIDGEWTMRSCIRDGHPLDARMVKSGRRLAQGGVNQIFFGAQLFAESTFRVDSASLPKSIDYTLADGRSQLGIYELEGDTLKIVYAAPSQTRPRDYSTKPGDGRTLSVWKVIDR